MQTAPPNINGLLLPNRLVHRSLKCPTNGWTRRPERGPHNHIMLAHACGIPSCCTYGVRRESCKAHPNWIPPATDATRRSFVSGTRSLGRGLIRTVVDEEGRGLDRWCWRWVSGFAIVWCSGLEDWIVSSSSSSCMHWEQEICDRFLRASRKTRRREKIRFYCHGAVQFKLPLQIKPFIFFHMI